MGTFVEKVEPTEAEYLVRFTQSEVDMLQGIVADLLDNPQRRVRMKYEVDGDYVAPSAKGMTTLRGVFEGFKPISESDEYDYYDYWDNVVETEEEA